MQAHFHIISLGKEKQNILKMYIEIYNILKTYPSNSEVLATQVKEVHWSNCIQSCLQGFIFNEAIASVLTNKNVE